jgi:hypothetical protein
LQIRGLVIVRKKLVTVHFSLRSARRDRKHWAPFTPRFAGPIEDIVHRWVGDQRKIKKLTLAES